MKLIVPEKVEEPALTSDVPLDETAWTAGTYATGVVRRVGIELYEVVAVPDTDDEPIAGSQLEPPSWLHIGKANRWRMFDDRIESQTEKSDSIEVEIETVGLVNGLAGFNIEARSVHVKLTDATDGVVYDREISMRDNSEVVDFYSWVFAPIVEKSDFVLTDLPSYPGAVLAVDIIAEGDVARCGQIVLGYLRNIGTTQPDTQVGILSFSRRDRDEFGNTILIKRPFARRGDFRVFIRTSQVGSAIRLLAKLDAVPVVYIGSDTYEETVIYGFCRDFFATYKSRDGSEFSMQIEGLV